MVDPVVVQAQEMLMRRRDELALEMRRITQALEALGHVEHDQPTPSALAAHQAARPSVRTMLLSLLDEEDRDWSTAEILAAYQGRGTPVHGADPNNALRAAMADAFSGEQIVRTERGRYKSAKWQGTAHLPAGSDEAQSAAEEVMP